VFVMEFLQISWLLDFNMTAAQGSNLILIDTEKVLIMKDLVPGLLEGIPRDREFLRFDKQMWILESVNASNEQNK
jgi:hypothetical protein